MSRRITGINLMSIDNFAPKTLHVKHFSNILCNAKIRVGLIVNRRIVTPQPWQRISHHRNWLRHSME